MTAFSIGEHLPTLTSPPLPLWSIFWLAALLQHLLQQLLVR